MTGIDDAARGVRASSWRSNEEPRHLLDRFLRGGKADALQRTGNQRGQPFHAQRQMRSAAITDDGMDLIHDQRADGGQHFAPEGA